MRDSLRLGLVLMLICAVSGGSLAYVHGVTSKIIDERKAKEVAQSMQTLLPSATDFAQVSADDLASIKSDKRFSNVETVFVGKVDGDFEGIVAKLEAPGYGGKIGLLVGVAADRSISGVQVLSQSETPGLGANVTKPEWREQFVGKGSSGPLAVTKDGGEIAALSGATISSRGVVAGVNVARDLVSPVAAIDGAGGANR